MSNGKILPGRQFDEFDKIGADYTEQMQDLTTAVATIAAADVGGLNVEATPHQESSVLVRTYVTPLDAMAAYMVVVPSTADIQVPDVLNSITVNYETASGSGSQVDTGATGGIGSNVSMSLDIPNSAQSSGAIIPSLLPNITRYWGVNRPVLHYMFYLPSPVSPADVLTRLTVAAGATVSAWPKFQPFGINFVIKGMRASVAATARVAQNVSIRGSSVSYTESEGEGSHFEIGLVVKEHMLPPMLFDTISYTGSATATISAVTTASMAAGTDWNALSAGGTPVTKVITGSVSPNVITATSPTAPPSSGLYLHRVRDEPAKWGQAKIIAEVFDFADL